MCNRQADNPGHRRSRRLRASKHSSDLRMIVLGIDYRRAPSASGPCARRSPDRRGASSTWPPARLRATRLPIAGERWKALLRRSAGGSPPRADAGGVTRSHPIRKRRPETGPGIDGAARSRARCRACGARPLPVRRLRALRGQIRRPIPRTRQPLTSPGSRHSFSLASPLRIVDFIVPSGTAKVFASSACDSPR